MNEQLSLVIWNKHETHQATMLALKPFGLDDPDSGAEFIWYEDTPLGCNLQEGEPVRATFMQTDERDKELEEELRGMLTEGFEEEVGDDELTIETFTIVLEKLAGEACKSCILTGCRFHSGQKK